MDGFRLIFLFAIFYIYYQNYMGLLNQLKLITQILFFLIKKHLHNLHFF